MGCYYHYCPCQEARPFLTDTEIERGVKNRQKDAMRKDYVQQKGYQIVEMWECEWWSLYKSDASVKSHLRENFPYRRPLSEEQLLQGIIDGRLFGDAQCDIEVPEHLRDYFSNFPPIFKNTVVSRDYIGSLLKLYAEKENNMVQARRMLISSFILTNGTLITPLLLIYLILGLVCKKIHWFLQNAPRKCFNNFVQSALDARRQRDKNPNSSVVAETMKLLDNSSNGYQIMDRSQHTVTKYLTDEKTHSAKNSKMFKRLNHITDELYEVELLKSEIEHREPIIVGFFILQYPKLRILELCYNFFKKFCDTDNYEELEMDTDSFYLALSEENLEDVILPEKRAEWDQLRSEDCTDNFTANAIDNFFPELAVMSTRNMTRDKRDCLKKKSGVPKCCACVAIPTVATIERVTSKNSVARDSMKELWKTVEMDPCQSIAKFWKRQSTLLQPIEDFEQWNIVLQSTSRQKRVVLFLPKRVVEEDGIHTKQLDL